MSRLVSSLHQFVMGFAEIGSLLVAGLPAAWANGPMDASTVYSARSMRGLRLAKVPSHPDMWGHSQSYHPAPQAERIVTPGYSVLPPPG